MSNEVEIRQILETLDVPAVDRPLGDIGRIADLVVGDTVNVDIELGIPSESIRSELSELVRLTVSDLTGGKSATVDVSAMRR